MVFRNGCFWTRSCALILSSQKWLNSSTTSACTAPQLHLSSGSLLQSCCGVTVAELRGEKGRVLHHWEGGQGEDVVLDVDILEHHEGAIDLSIVAVTNCGFVLKQSI